LSQPPAQTPAQPVPFNRPNRPQQVQAQPTVVTPPANSEPFPRRVEQTNRPAPVERATPVTPPANQTPPAREPRREHPKAKEQKHEKKSDDKK
jgi:hypothetical protein